MTPNTKTVAYVDSLSRAAREQLAAYGGITQLPFPSGAKRAEFDALLKSNPSVNAVILGAQPVSAPQLELAKHLQVVARVGVGYDMIDIPALAPRRIPLMIAGIANSPSVAEEAFHLMFALSKRAREHDRLVREGRWAHARVAEPPGDLCYKTLLVVGFGRIGSRVVRRGIAMDMDVLVFDPFVSSETITAAGAMPVSRLDDALPLADFVTLHCPRSPDTLGLIDARRLALMKPSALLINTARGGIIDEAALFTALKTNAIAGAGLDVLAEEPPPADHPLFQLSNVIFAPHMAGVTREALDRMSEAAVANVLSVFDGAPLAVNVVNKDVLRP